MVTMDKYSKTKEAISKISALGFNVVTINPSEIQFTFNNKKVIYYPRKEWATGATIKDCRGLGKLLEQIKPNSELSKYPHIIDIKKKLLESISEAHANSEKAENEEMYFRFDASANAFQFILDFINSEQ